MKTTYVCGFLMDFEQTCFLGIDKGGMVVGEGTPEKFILKVQGLGGKLKEGRNPANDGEEWEHPKDAMNREFAEETGFKVRLGWHCFMVKEYERDKIYMFVAHTSKSEMVEIAAYRKSNPSSEGPINVYDIVDTMFDFNQFTHDVPALLQYVMAETSNGTLHKLDPEGVNS